MPLESLIQNKFVGDSYPGAFTQGHTFRNSETHRRHPQGWQAVVRNSGDLALVVIHTFCGHTIIAGVDIAESMGVVNLELDESNTEGHRAIYPGGNVRLIRQTGQGTFLMS